MDKIMSLTVEQVCSIQLVSSRWLECVSNTEKERKLNLLAASSERKRATLAPQPHPWLAHARHNHP